MKRSRTLLAVAAMVAATPAVAGIAAAPSAFADDAAATPPADGASTTTAPAPDAAATAVAEAVAEGAVVGAANTDAAVDQAPTAELAQATTATEDVVVSAGGTAVELPANAADGVTLTLPNGMEFVLHLPGGGTAKVLPGGDEVAYDAGDGSASFVRMLADGSLQVRLAISNSSAPEEYRFPILQGYAGFSMATTADGGVDILAPNGAKVLGIAPPWALDSADAQVPVAYTVEGETLLVSVAHRSGAYAYPVTADPWWRALATGVIIGVGAAATTFVSGPVAVGAITGGAAVAAYCVGFADACPIGSSQSHQQPTTWTDPLYPGISYSTSSSVCSSTGGCK